MDITTDWKEVKRLFNNSFRSSFHFAIASVTGNGEPHVTPIGSLILGNPGHGFYFERFTNNLPHNLESNKKICVLAVNSSLWYWLKSLVAGRFKSPPAVRLHGTVGELRSASEKEITLWRRRVSHVSFSKGHALMWKKMNMVRDIEFTRIEPVHLGEMTHNNWNIRSGNGDTDGLTR